jgi:hypothetical protein
MGGHYHRRVTNEKKALTVSENMVILLSLRREGGAANLKIRL